MKNLFYRKLSLKSYPPHKFDDGFMMQSPEECVIRSGESRKIDFQLMLKLPLYHIGKVITPPLEGNLIVKPLTLSGRMSKIKIEISNSSDKDITCRKGRGIAFLVCIKVANISTCMELRCGFFLNFNGVVICLFIVYA